MKEVVETVTHKAILAEISKVTYEKDGVASEFVSVKFKRVLPSGRITSDFRSRDLEDLIDAIDKVRPSLEQAEAPVKQRIAKMHADRRKAREKQRSRLSPDSKS